MPENINFDILNKFRESFLKNNTNESEQKQWDTILEHHASLQQYTNELIDFISGTDLDIHKSIENLINTLVQINNAMNSYKKSLQVAPNQNPDKYIKEYISQIEEKFSKQITLAQQLVLDSIKKSAGNSNDSDEAKLASGLMHIHNIMLKVHKQIQAELTKNTQPKVQEEQIRRDSSAAKHTKYSRHKYNQILDDIKNSENELEMTLHTVNDANTYETGKKQIAEMINNVNKLIKQIDVQCRMENRRKYKMDLLTIKSHFVERLESLNQLEELYSEELKKPIKDKSSHTLGDSKDTQEIERLLNPLSNPTHNTTGHEQSIPPTIKAASHTTQSTDKNKAESPKSQSSRLNR